MLAARDLWVPETGSAPFLDWIACGNFMHPARAMPHPITGPFRFSSGERLVPAYRAAGEALVENRGRVHLAGGGRGHAGDPGAWLAGHRHGPGLARRRVPVGPSAAESP